MPQEVLLVFLDGTEKPYRTDEPLSTFIKHEDTSKGVCRFRRANKINEAGHEIYNEVPPDTE